MRLKDLYIIQRKYMINLFLILYISYIIIYFLILFEYMKNHLCSLVFTFFRADSKNDLQVYEVNL